MTSASSKTQLVRFDETIPQTKLVAVLQLEPNELMQRGVPNFVEGYDDLDYLIFSVLTLPTSSCVAFVKHQGSFERGTEVYVDPNELNFTSVLTEALTFLNLSFNSFSWVYS